MKTHTKFLHILIEDLLDLAAKLFFALLILKDVLGLELRDDLPLTSTHLMLGLIISFALKIVHTWFKYRD